MKKIKVLLICHFSNQAVRSKLSLRENLEYHDFGVWITNRIAGYEKSAEIELHVVAPHKGMKLRKQSFDIKGIRYYFYNTGNPLAKFIETGLSYSINKTGNNLINRSLQSLLGYFRKLRYLPQKRYVRDLVETIQPDLIHLNGAENPYYSSTVIGLEKTGIPVCVSIQGIVSDPQTRKHIQVFDRTKISLERKIHGLFRYYITGTTDHYNLVKRDNPNAVFLFSPGVRTINIDPDKELIQKEFSFVFFASITPIKGIEQLLKAISILKEDHPVVSLLLMGPVSETYLKHLMEMCKSYGILDNVEYRGHIARREDLFREALKAKIYVLPTLVEGLATSAVEAMLLGLPVVTYRTGGMPFLNKDGENVLMSKTGDIEELVHNMKRFLEDSDYAGILAKRGQEFARRIFGEEANIRLNIRQYRAILANYHDNIPIPEELVFSGKYK